MQSLPHLPQPRPASSGSPSSRNRSVQRLREAVTEVRQSWSSSSGAMVGGGGGGASSASGSVGRAGSVGGSVLRSGGGGASPSSISDPRSMVVRLPLRGRTPGSPMGGAADASGADGMQQQLQQQQQSQLSPMPNSPYVFYSGDPSPAAVAQLCRGARVVRAHGLMQGGEDGIVMSSAQLFGSYSPSSKGRPGSGDGSRPPSGSNRRKSAAAAAGDDTGRSTATGDDADTTGSSIDTARLEKQTEEELAARTRRLLAGDVKPLLDARSIFFNPGLLSGTGSGSLLAPQIADEFTAGNSRRKMVSVIRREATNGAALRALEKAKKAVREHNKIVAEAEEAKNHSHHHADDDAGAGGGGGGAEDPDAPVVHRHKEKDAETLAREAVIEAEAKRVRGACELLRGGRLDGTNHATLFARLRRILTVVPSGSSGSSRAERFTVPPLDLLRVVADWMDAPPPAAPQWESLAAMELAAAEKARVAREAKSYRRGGGGASSSAVAPSPSVGSGSLVANPSSGDLASSPSGAISPPADGAAAATEAGADAASAAGSSPVPHGAVAAEASGGISDASFAAVRSPFANSQNLGSGGIAAGDKLLPLFFPPIADFCRNPQPGALLSSLTEEFVASLLDPARQLTVNRVLSDTGFSNGRSVGQIFAQVPVWSPMLEVEQVSRLVDGLLRAMKGDLLDTVLISVFNFITAAVECREKWTAVCNSVEDSMQRARAEAAEMAAQEERATFEHRARSRGGGANSNTTPQRQSTRGRSPPQSSTKSNAPSPGAGGGGGGGVPSSPAVASSSAPPPLSPTLQSPQSPTATVPAGGDPMASSFRGRDNRSPDRADDAFPSVQNNEHDNNCDIPDDVFRVALLSSRPEGMSRDFYELECLAFEPFSKLVHLVADRRHFSGAASEEAEEATFGVLRALCSSMQSAFRIVLQEEQIAQIMANSKKKKKIDPSELPPVFPSKTTVLRFKDFRQIFKTNEKVAGPLLPFVLAAVIESLAPAGQLCRWRMPAPMSAFL